MDKELLITIITGISTISSVIISNRATNKEVTHKLETHQAVTDTKLDNITAEVHKNNQYAERVPVIEERLNDCVRRVEVVENETKRQTGKAH